MRWKPGEVYDLKSAVDDTQIELSIIACDWKQNIHTGIKRIFDPVLQSYSEPELSIFRWEGDGQYCEMYVNNFEQSDDNKNTETDLEIVENFLKDLEK